MRFPTESPTLHGAHVTLEPLHAGHVAQLGEAASDGELWRAWYTSVPTPQGMAAYVEHALAQQAQGQCIAFAVLDASGTVVGSTRFYDLDAAVPRVAIGYTWYAKRVQRTGLNTQAKRLLLAYAFETLGCECVGFETSWFNQRSRQAIARLGARQDGVLRAHMRHADGSLRDTVCFSILAAEWPAVRTHLDARLEAHARG